MLCFIPHWTRSWWALSGLADIGRTHLSAIERGERKPTLETLYRIACALDVPMSALVLDMEAEMVRRQG